MVRHKLSKIYCAWLRRSSTSAAPSMWREQSMCSCLFCLRSLQLTWVTLRKCHNRRLLHFLITVVMTLALLVNLILILVAAGYCCDKNTQISEISVKLLARLIENIGNSFVHLNPETLQNIMKNLAGLIDGKRQNLRNQGLDICLFIYNLIGSENYLSLMNYSLKPE